MTAAERDLRERFAAVLHDAGCARTTGQGCFGPNCPANPPAPVLDALVAVVRPLLDPPPATKPSVVESLARSARDRADVLSAEARTYESSRQLAPLANGLRDEARRLRHDAAVLEDDLLGPDRFGL